MPVKGDKNLYTCMLCEGFIVTEDVDDGVTPMMLACRATSGCDGVMYSAGYPPTEVIGDEQPTWEWYRPTLKQARRMSQEMQQHVAQGGLALRERTNGA